MVSKETIDFIKEAHDNYIESDNKLLADEGLFEDYLEIIIDWENREKKITYEKLPDKVGSPSA